jgi:glycosyltransferase involved in cell wall biosynthesis
MDFIAKSKSRTVRNLLSWADIIHVYDIYSLFLLCEFARVDAKIVYSANASFNVGLSDLASSGLRSFRNMAKPNYLWDVLLPNGFFSHTLSMADNIVSWTRFMQEKIRSINAADSVYIPIGVNFERFRPNKNEVDKNFTFLYLGYLASARGVDDLIKAFELTNREWSSTRLIISHTGLHPSEQNLVLSKICKLRPRSIEISGFSKNLSEILNRSNAVVLPFRTTVGYTQPPLTVLEALAHGRPVITTNVGCLPEIIKDGINGFCVPPNNPRLLAESMLEMRQADLDCLSKEANDYILQNHDWQKNVEMTIRVYRRTASMNK